MSIHDLGLLLVSVFTADALTFIQPKLALFSWFYIPKRTICVYRSRRSSSVRS